MSYNAWKTGGLPYLNIALTCHATRSLGSGVRAVVWVQGCPLNCPNCIAPDWIPHHNTRLALPEEIVEELLQCPEVTGLTFSGGEPMMQAAGLASIARIARKHRDLSVISFTGFTLEQLRKSPPHPGVIDLLEQTDVLIDAPYINSLNNNRGLRGSSNQSVHFLTSRLKDSRYDFEAQPRQAEVHVQDGRVTLVGVPPDGSLTAFESAVTRLSHMFNKMNDQNNNDK